MNSKKKKIFVMEPNIRKMIEEIETKSRILDAYKNELKDW